MTDFEPRFMERFSSWLRTVLPEQVSATRSDARLPFSPLDGLDNASSEQLRRAQEAWTTARDLWQDEEDAFEFLTRRHALLDEQRPIMVAFASREGLHSVRSLIERLRYGSAA